MAAVRVTFLHWRTRRRPFRHTVRMPGARGPAYLTAFARFLGKRLSAIGKFKHGVKDHHSAFFSFNFRVPPRTKYDTFYHLFVKSSSFPVSHSATVVGNAVRDCRRRGQRRGASALGRSREVSDVTTDVRMAAVSRGRINRRRGVRYLA